MRYLFILFAFAVSLTIYESSTALAEDIQGTDEAISTLEDLGTLYIEEYIDQNYAGLVEDIKRQVPEEVVAVGTAIYKGEIETSYEGWGIQLRTDSIHIGHKWVF